VKAAKVAYKQRLSEAVQWLQGEGQGGTVANASRVYEVNHNAIRMALKRDRQYTQQKRAQVLHGGHNKALSDTQSKAIEAYCYEQWEMGMGATKKMVFAAIWLDGDMVCLEEGE
jgi:hypothetical protein